MENNFSKLNEIISKNNYSLVFILCDNNTYRHCLPIFIEHCKWASKAHIIKIKPGEKQKNLRTCEIIWSQLLKFNADRRSLLINLGGGVISDLGSFCASVYKRGIDFVNIPTTLLAMVDAAIGGKTGINFLNLKNNIGSFYFPKGIFVYPDYLKTLPHSQNLNGRSEMYKIALLTSKKMLQELISSGEKINEHLISECIFQKNKLVNKDPNEKNIRKIF